MDRRIAYNYFNENYEQFARLHNEGLTVDEIYYIARNDSGFTNKVRLEKLRQLIIDHFCGVGMIPLY